MELHSSMSWPRLISTNKGKSAQPTQSIQSALCLHCSENMEFPTERWQNCLWDSKWLCEWCLWKRTKLFSLESPSDGVLTEIKGPGCVMTFTSWVFRRKWPDSWKKTVSSFILCKIFKTMLPLPLFAKLCGGFAPVLHGQSERSLTSVYLISLGYHGFSKGNTCSGKQNMVSWQCGRHTKQSVGLRTLWPWFPGLKNQE